MKHSSPITSTICKNNFSKFHYWFKKENPSSKTEKVITVYALVCNVVVSLTSHPASPQGAGKKGIMRQNELGLYSNIPSLNVPRIYGGD
jgi:hypothetical protein